MTQGRRVRTAQEDVAVEEEAAFERRKCNMRCAAQKNATFQESKKLRKVSRKIYVAVSATAFLEHC